MTQAPSSRGVWEVSSGNYALRVRPGKHVLLLVVVRAGLAHRRKRGYLHFLLEGVELVGRSRVTGKGTGYKGGPACGINHELRGMVSG